MNMLRFFKKKIWLMYKLNIRYWIWNRWTCDRFGEPARRSDRLGDDFDWL